MSTLIYGLGDTVRALASQVGPGVVGLDGWRGASGVVLASGKVLTNAHNVRGDTVHARLGDGQAVEGTVSGVDADGDLAVVSVDTGSAVALPWADGAVVDIGTPVFAVSSTQHGPRVTFGLVSATARPFRGPRGRRIAGSIEHTAPMAPGSSGSALVDADGRLVGLNTHRIEGGLYLALPADAALRARVDALGRGESPARPRLGIGIAPTWAARRMRRSVGLPELDGLLVRDVQADGRADRAGITMGDLIVAAGGRSMSDVDDLADVLATASGAIELTVIRGTDQRTVEVPLGD